MPRPHDIALQMPTDAEMDAWDNLEEAFARIERCIEDNATTRSQALCALAAIRPYLHPAPLAHGETVSPPPRVGAEPAGGVGSSASPAFSNTRTKESDQ